jgi:phage gp45-like
MMWKDIQDRINRAVSSLKTGITGKISSVIKDSDEVFVKSTEDIELRDVKIMAPYGLKSLPLPGLDAQIIFNNSGKKASLVGVDSDSPIQLDIGETILFNSKAKTYIHLKNDGKVYIHGDIVADNITATTVNGKTI